MRTPAAVLALGLALAIGTPTAWALSRPEPAAGAAVVEALGSPPAAAPPPAAPPLPAAPTPPAPPLPTATARPAVPATVAAPVPPVRLAVPGRGIDAAVDPVGVGPDGAMALPADVDRVGWYRFGPAPGGAGSAVVAGHVDSWDQGLGALAPLREVQVDDEVLVTDAAGAQIRWRVVGRDLMAKQALPPELFARTGEPRLVLITCGGEYLPELRAYRENVVVVAVPV